MKKVYGYLRVSTTKQGEGVSLIEQKEAITRYAAQYSLEIIEWFEEKETAAKLGRPLFTRMMKQLQNRNASGVIIHKIDRGARNLKDWSDLGTLIDQGVEVHFAHESLDLQARGGRLSADIQAVIAADYIRNLRQETIKGIYGRLKQGFYPFHAPTGYLNNGPGKHKTIDPIQGPLVRKAFELYSTKRYTLETLAAHMEKLGLKNIRRSKVAINRLSVILNNPFYIGIIKVKGESFRGGHDTLISPHLFKRVQAILRSKDNQKTLKHVFKFRKLIKCKHCGYSLVAETQKDHTYYRCHTKNCPTKGFRERTLDNYLVKAFTAAQLYSEEVVTMKEQLLETEKEWATKQQELLRGVKLQAAGIDEKLERLTDCYVEGGLDKEIYEKRKEKLLFESKEKEAAQKDLLRGKERTLRRVEKFLELGKSLILSYTKGILEEQRELVEIVTSNLMAEGKKLVISMQSPFSEMVNRWNLTSCAPDRGTPRKIEGENVTLPANDLSPRDPLNREQLKSLLDTIIAAVSKLPENNTETDYDI